MIEKLKDSHFMKANHISPVSVMRYHYRPIDIPPPPPPVPPPPHDFFSHIQEKDLEDSSHEILCSEVNERQCSIEFEPSVSLQYLCATNVVISLSESSLIGNVSKLIQYRTKPCGGSVVCLVCPSRTVTQISARSE